MDSRDLFGHGTDRSGYDPSLVRGFDEASRHVGNRVIVAKTANDVHRQADVVLRRLSPVTIARVSVSTRPAPVKGNSYGPRDAPRSGESSDYRPAAWRHGTDVRMLAGRPIRLRFVLRDADPYSLRFRCSRPIRPHPVAPVGSFLPWSTF